VIVIIMKSPILILFIIFNLLAANLVSAMNIYTEDTIESHHVHSQANSTDNTILENGFDTSSCDHMCHVSSHMIGFISQITHIQAVDNLIDLPVLNEPLHSLILDPPFQPPKA